MILKYYGKQDRRVEVSQRYFQNCMHRQGGVGTDFRQIEVLFLYFYSLSLASFGQIVCHSIFGNLSPKYKTKKTIIQVQNALSEVFCPQSCRKHSPTPQGAEVHQTSLSLSQPDLVSLLSGSSSPLPEHGLLDKDLKLSLDGHWPQTHALADGNSRLHNFSSVFKRWAGDVFHILLLQPVWGGGMSRQCHLLVLRSPRWRGTLFRSSRQTSKLMQSSVCDKQAYQ